MFPFDPFNPCTVAGALEGIKTAARLSGALGGAGALLGVGSGVGALLGAGAGGLQGYRESREQGVPSSEAIGHALSGAGRGAVAGGITGAALGGLGGGIAGSLAPKAMEAGRSYLTGAKGPVGSLARFGQRQVHGLTGHVPEGGLAELRHGAASRRDAVQEAEAHLDRVIEEGGTPTLMSRLRGRSAAHEAADRLRQANQAYGASADAERRGLTSLPGYVRALHRDGIGPTLRAGFRDQVRGMSPAMKVLTLGMPAADIAGAAGPSEPGGPTRSERVGRALGGAAGMVLSPLPQGTQMLLQPGLAALGGRVGRALGPSPEM